MNGDATNEKELKKICDRFLMKGHCLSANARRDDIKYVWEDYMVQELLAKHRESYTLFDSVSAGCLPQMQEQLRELAERYVASSI